MPYQSPAILGATSLGGQLATMFANAGRRVRLYDKALSDAQPNALGQQLINQLLSEYPSAALTIEASNRIDVRNYRDHLHLLHSHDLIIDCSEDNLNHKQGLWMRLAPTFAKQATLISHLDSVDGEAIASALPAGRRQYFFGAHFSLYHESQGFLELMAHERSENRLRAPLERYFQEELGIPCLWIPSQAEQVVKRLAVFAIGSAYHYAEHYGLTAHELELLTGLLWGNGAYGVAYLADSFGLQRLHEAYEYVIAHEPAHIGQQLCFPKRFVRLLSKGFQGKVSRRGVYDYRHYPAHFTPHSKALPNLDAHTVNAYKNHDWLSLHQLTHPHARFLSTYAQHNYQYAMQLCARLSLDGHKLDQLTRHAFGWNIGWYAQFQAFGAKAVLSHNHELPYPSSQHWQARRNRKKNQPDEQQTTCPPHSQLLKHYPHSSSYQYHKQLLIWQPKHAVCTLSPAVMQELLDTLHYARHNQSALVIYHHGSQLGMPLQPDAEPFEAWYAHQQLLNQVVMSLRLNPYPIYASLRGQIYDHGYALMMQVDQLLCTHDSQLHLSTIAQQLPSLGGIWLEWLRRLPSIDEDNHIVQIFSIFKYLLQNPSHSIASARHVGLLRPRDIIVPQHNQLLHTTEQALPRWAHHQEPRVQRYGRASLSMSQLYRLATQAHKTANPSLYRDLLSLLAQQNHSLSLSTLLEHELALLCQRLNAQP